MAPVPRVRGDRVARALALAFIKVWPAAERLVRNYQ